MSAALAYLVDDLQMPRRAYLDKVAEEGFSDVGDAATAGTVACPACAVVTVPIGLAAKAGEFVKSDNKLKTTATTVLGVGTGGAGKFIAKDLGAIAAPTMKRAEESGSYLGEEWLDALWPKGTNNDQ